MNKLRTMTAIGLSAAVFAGGCGGETPVDPEQQEKNRIAERTADKVVGQLVEFAESDRAKGDLNDGAVISFDTRLGGEVAVAKLFFDKLSDIRDCEDETRDYAAEVQYDDEEPAQVSELIVESEVGYRLGDCDEQDRYTTVREFKRDEDGNWTATVSRDTVVAGNDPLSRSTLKEAETVGAMRQIAADALKDIELLLADEPR